MSADHALQLNERPKSFGAALTPHVDNAHAATDLSRAFVRGVTQSVGLPCATRCVLVQVVAQGAAIQGSILKGDTKGLVLIDVTPLSLGTEIVGGVFSRIINRNTSIPCKNEQEYTTVKDMQTNIAVKV